MKKLLIALGLILTTAVCRAGTQEVKEVARAWNVGPVSVSTITVTTMTVAGITGYSGRFKVMIQNLDPTWYISLSTSPNMTFAQGWVLYGSTSAPNNTITLPLPAGTTIWAIGQNNSTLTPMAARIIELK